MNKYYHIKTRTLILLLTTMLTGCLSNSSSPNNTGAPGNTVNLQTVLNNALNSADAKSSYITGLPLTFECNGFNNNQPVTLSSGKMSIDNDAPNLSPDAIYQIGSSSKSFLAVVALQLAYEINPSTGQKYFGDKGLDSTVGEVLGNPVSSATWNVAWNKVTLRQLLNMTSGIPDCVDAAVPTYAQNPYHYFSTDELIGFVVNKKSDFEPGQGWKYSNTNYAIMNKIISYLTNSSINEQITRRIIDKLGLTHTYYVDDLPMNAITIPYQKLLLMSGYFGQIVGGVLYYNSDLSRYSLSISNAAGSIISNTSDMNKYVHALFDDKNGLLDPNELQELTRVVATEDFDQYKAGQYIPAVDREAKNKSYGLGYGLGIMSFFVDLPNGHSIAFYAHGGDTLSFDSNWIYSPQKKAYATYVFNSQAPTVQKVRAYLEGQIYKKIDNECSSNWAQSE